MKIDDLVMLRLPNDLNEKGRKDHFNTWFRVVFVDNDDTFIGEVQKVDRFEFLLYKIGEHVKLSTDKILHTYKNGEQFCYGDNITICECSGLCRNK